MRYWYGILLAVGLLAACSQSPQGVNPQAVVVPASVTVEKTAVPKFKRTYRWTIAKQVTDPASGTLTLATGQAYTLKYAVNLLGTPTDSDFRVEGRVTIRNTGSVPVELQAPTDTITPGGIGVTLNCGVTFPYTLSPGSSLVCDYSQALPDGQSRTNSVAVSWSGGGQSGTATAQAGFSFTNPTEVVDGSVTVSDPSATLVSSISGIDPQGVISQTHFFERTVSFDRCGEYRVENTATFTTNTTGTQGSASATVQVNVPCVGGCTLTQGYWKTHSRYGPAPYDDTWAQIGEDTPFYLSGKGYYQVLWTPPSGGNAYYILAHQFIAARLNILNGAATTPAVDAALAWAHTFFQTYRPTDSLSKALANQAKGYAATLDSYNNGYIGPGHCSE
ncbi:hypothetical protein TCCBUS3UF1_21590 [Thermus sp. CCB_US3_UF1]|uniref:hypothetical protein n=1 Tax=Thermus sp. CCB_US3_UF1 TaxID=1111069 RepID=UPI0002389302|nr:hypothetical protein [Thermus sp. CCB_US3_UF1]AEV17195.1 hypothetical protein TCCBUS3UF1_21590 [Thermus sp. CCB_US3_UF1]